MNYNYSVVGIGSAIVDILSHVDDHLLATNALPKGSMQLVDEAQSQALYKQLGQSMECSGGSAANTLAGIASLGGKVAFIGKVADDQLGNIFSHDMRATGVAFDTPVAQSGPSTASCIVCVTPDAQRTMATYLGACTGLSEIDMDETLISQAQLLYVEGYQWDMPAAKAAIRKAMNAAHKVSITLSDTFCVERFRDEFNALIDAQVDVLFANEGELLSLTQESDFDAAVRKIQGRVEVAAITRSEKGAVIITTDKIEVIAGEKVAKLVDTTGAGDLFAAGFLYGYTQGWAHAKSAQLGNKCAAAIIQQLGARAMKPLDQLVA